MGTPEEVLAINALAMNKNKFWCITCGRPRIKLYCPASSHSTREHKVIRRSLISDADQVRYYMGNKFRGDR